MMISYKQGLLLSVVVLGITPVLATQQAVCSDLVPMHLESFCVWVIRTDNTSHMGQLKVKGNTIQLCFQNHVEGCKNKIECLCPYTGPEFVMKQYIGHVKDKYTNGKCPYMKEPVKKQSQLSYFCFVMKGTNDATPTTETMKIVFIKPITQKIVKSGKFRCNTTTGTIGLAEKLCLQLLDYVCRSTKIEFSLINKYALQQYIASDKIIKKLIDFSGNNAIGEIYRVEHKFKGNVVTEVRPSTVKLDSTWRLMEFVRSDQAGDSRWMAGYASKHDPDTFYGKTQGWNTETQVISWQHRKDLGLSNEGSIIRYYFVPTGRNKDKTWEDVLEQFKVVFDKSYNFTGKPDKWDNHLTYLIKNRGASASLNKRRLSNSSGPFDKLCKEIFA